MYSSTSDLSRRLSKSTLGRLPNDLTSSSASLTASSRRKSLPNVVCLSPLQQGKLQQLVAPKLSLVKIFLCCNPEDSSLERKELRGAVAKKLRQKFEETWDIEFKIIDGYESYGIYSLSHEDRLKEIACCHDTSMSVCFVALVGQKYWSMHVPRCISANVFEILLRLAYAGKFANCKLLEKYYERNENTIPAEYVTRQHRSLSTKTGLKSSLFQLHALLRQVAQSALAQNLLTTSQVEKFIISSFHKELQFGLLHKPSIDAKKCMCYVRTITDMERDMNITRVHKYVDVALNSANLPSSSYVSTEMMDLDAQQKITFIREKEIPSVVADTEGQLRVYTCSVKWLPQIGLQKETHKSYLEDFCHQFCTTVTKIASQNIDSIRKQCTSGEAMCHCLLAKQISQNFVNTHPNIREQLIEYICGMSRSPLLLHGKSGTGKTYLLSNIADNVHWLIPNAANAILIIRFVGKTIASSWAAPLLDNICCHLEKCFLGQNEPPGIWCTEILQLQTRLKGLLHKASQSHPILLLIDGLDDLNDLQKFDSLSDWLPCDLPDNVKMIVSMNSDHNLFEKFHAKASTNGFSTAVTRPLSQKEYISFIRTQLANIGRQITSGQYVYAMQATATEIKDQYTPGLATSLLAHAKHWKSSDDVKSNEVGQGKAGVIKKLLLQLKRKYGKHVVHFAAALISVVTYGITEQDILDLLVSTNQVKAEMLHFLQQNDLIGKENEEDVIRNAINNCLFLLLNKLSDLLHIKYIGGCQVYCWCSNSVATAILSTFSAQEIANVRKCLVNHHVMFMQRKSNSPTKEPLKSLYVAMELSSTCETAEIQNCVAEIVPLSFSWLHTILHSLGVVQLLSLLEQFYRHSKDRAVLVVERAIRLALPVLHRSIHAFSGEMFSRLSYFASSYPCLEKLVNDCVTHQPNTMLLIPAGIHAHSPGAPLRVSISEHQQIAKSVIVYEKGSVMCLTYCCGTSLKIYDMHTGDIIREVLFKDDIEWIKISTNLEFVIIFLPYHQNLFILDEKTCNCNHKLSLLGSGFTTGNKEVPSRSIDAYLNATLAAVWARDYSCTIILVNIITGNIICTVLCIEEVHECRLTNNEKTLIALSLPQSVWLYDVRTGDSILHVLESRSRQLLAVHSSGFVNVWSPQTNTQQYTHGLELDSRSAIHGDIPAVSAALSPSGERLLIVKPYEVDIWNLRDWKVECEIVSQGVDFCCAEFSNQEEYIFVTSCGDPSLYVWKIESSTCVAIFYGHSNDISGICVPRFTTPQAKSTWIVTYEYCESIKVWNLENMSLIPTLTTTGRSIQSVCCIDQNTVTTDGTDTVVVWETLNGDTKYLLKHCSTVSHCCVSSNKILTADDSGYQYVWNITTGENLVKIKGPQVSSIIITPNHQMAISMFEEAAESQPGNSCASQVWHLETAQVICTFDYTLRNVQVTSKNTFLVGISLDGKLNAISLWMGMLAKVLSNPGADITFLHAISKRDEVITVNARNIVCLWSIPVGSILVTLDMKSTIMRDIRISDSGSMVTFMDPKQGFRALDVKLGKLRSVETKSVPIMSQISSDGLHLFYIGMKTIQATYDGVPQEAEYDLVVAKLTTGKTLITYPLESTPTCMDLSKTGKKVAIGLEEGRTVVFNLITNETPVRLPAVKTKNMKKKVLFSKSKCDGIWHTYEPKYEAHIDDTPGYRPHYSQSQNKHFSQSKHSSSSRQAKMSVHMQRNSSPASKSVNLSRISSSSKVRVFM